VPQPAERERFVTSELEQLRLSIHTVDSRDGAATIAVAGECDLYEAHLLESALAEAGAAPGTSVYLDLSELSFLDSTGLHVLVKAQRSFEAAGSELVLVAPTEQVRRTLAVSGLEGQFAVREELEDPVAEIAGSLPDDDRPASFDSLFRSVNERILELSSDWGAGELHFFCECRDSGCTRPVSMSAESYERLRAVSGSVVVSAAHAEIGRWDVVETGDGYVLVRDPDATFRRNGGGHSVDV
jgi:anti-sigma B factor antagonist